MSMIKREKLTKSERLEIEILLGKNYPYRRIAAVLGRSPNTISYEIRTNGGVLGYNALNADQYASTRKKDTRREWSKIEHNHELRSYIIDGLGKHWNPDEIAGKMREEYKPWYASKTAIYEWLRSAYGQRYCIHLYTQRYDKKQRIKKTERVMIPDRISILKRFRGATNRTRYGHWERDTIVSRKGCSGGLSVGLERKTRLVVATKVLSMASNEHIEAAQRQKEKYKTLSITYDNGIENRNHKEIGTPSFFCDAYSSWQKGGVENANKMIRRYFPKGTNFREVSQKRVDQIVSIINSKPRKILGYRSAFEAATASGIILTTKCPN